MLAAILDNEPPPLARFLPDVPAELQRIVTKCLRKDRDERYETMKDLLLDLKELRDELTVGAKLERSVRPATDSVENQQTLVAEGGVTREAALQTGPASAQTTSRAEYLVSEIKQHKRGIAVVLLMVLLAALGLGYSYFYRVASDKQIGSIAVMPKSGVTASIC